MANDMIRMSGMNSGLDTESIINALTASSKLKVTKQERNVLKYEATQEAYRDIISKMSSIKDKYFNLLNNSSNLTGTSMWSKYKATSTDQNGNNVTGLSVETTINSQAGEYEFEVKDKATQAKLSGAKIGGNASVSVNDITNQTDESGNFKTLGITVSVGGEEKNITFMSAATERETLDNLNQQLEDAFGQSNVSSQTNGTKTDYQGMVYVDDFGKVVSRESKSVTISGVGSMEKDNSLNMNNVKSGTNTLTFQVEDKSVSVSFQTISKDYFDSAISAGLINSSTGEVLIPDTEKDEDGNYVWHTKSKALAQSELGDDASEEEVQARANEIFSQWDSAVSLYKEITEDYKDSVRYKAYQDYMEDDSDGSKLEKLYQNALEEHKKSTVNKWIEGTGGTSQIKKSVETITNAYNTYKDGLAEGEEAEDIASWARASTDSDVAAAVSKLNNAYEGTGDGETDYDAAFYDEKYTEYKNDYANANLSDTSKSAYETYKAAEGDSALGIYEWADTYGSAEANAAKAELDAAKANEDTPFMDQAAWKEDFTANESWHLNKTTWNTDGNKFTAFKNLAKTDDDFKANVFNEDTHDYGITKTKIYNHFTESSIKNSIGKLTSDDVKFDATFDSSTGKVNISAYREDGDGNKTDVAVSMTVAQGSANKASDFGLSTTSDAAVQLSQISNATKLSEIMGTTEGTFGFEINGVSFSFDASTTVNDMMKKVNASSAGVKMAFSSLNNQFSITSSSYGVDGKVDIDEDNALLKNLGLSSKTGGEFTAGTNLKVNITTSNGTTTYESSGNTVEADGTTFTFSDKVKAGTTFTTTIEKDTSAISDVIKGFVEEYNKLVEDVYKLLDEKPEKDYYFLADQDKEDLDLTEKQEEKWEEKSKKGLLYHDSTTTNIMSKLRLALMGNVEGLDGNTFSLLDLGIKTESDYSKHGKFAAIDEDKLASAIENHSDDIMKLFTDSENGIMKKFSEVLEGAVGSTGDSKGSLVKKAGLATGSTATNNELYSAIKRAKSKITDLTKRYENEQDRLWKRYSNMESMMGTLNSQSSQFASYFMQ